MTRFEGGSCSVIAYEETQNMALDLLPVRFEELMELEPLEVSPVAVLGGQVVPEAVLCDWVAQWVKFFDILRACHMRGMRSICGLCLQL